MIEHWEETQTQGSSPPDYRAFLAGKRIEDRPTGLSVPEEELHPRLFPFQRSIVRWALKRGRAACFAATGLGKTLIQLEWARQIHARTGRDVLILAPLAVSHQTAREARKLDLDVTVCRRQADVRAGVNVTNYEMLGHFDQSAFGAVVLDESGILKAFDGRTRTLLIETFRETSFRLCCTATPAPNDIAEMANHAEFLGLMTRAEMLAAFFVHDDQGWRLKGHAREPFYRWLASWGMSLNKPSDLGFDDATFDLPPLSIHPILVPTDYAPPGQLFSSGLKGIGERAAVRRDTSSLRVKAAAELIRLEPNEPWIAWVGLNDEGRQLAAVLPHRLLVEGQQSPDEKADALLSFVRGDVRIMVTKATIAGYGLNLQHCARMVFVGMGDSFEQYFQCIRRCWRFGQKRAVEVYIVLTEPEEPIYRNVLRKEAEHKTLSESLIRHVQLYEQQELGAAQGSHDTYRPQVTMRLPAWLQGENRGSHSSGVR